MTNKPTKNKVYFYTAVISLLLCLIISPVMAITWVADGPGHWNATIDIMSYEMWDTVGTYTWVRPPGVTTVNYLVIGGGGGGGRSSVGAADYGAGGGGAGGVLQSSVSLLSTDQMVIVGRGGYRTGADTPYVLAESSQFGNATIAKMGGEGGSQETPPTLGYGSGGGSANNYVTQPAGGGDIFQGFYGGVGTVYPPTGSIYGVGGGGGGAYGSGGNGQYVMGTSAYVSGAGGLGIQSSITGTAVYYAGGGGGAPYDGIPTGYSGTGGSGGLGGGGNGQSKGSTTQPGNGADKFGGGGGAAASSSSIPGKGGNGTVIISYPANSTITLSTVSWDEDTYIRHQVANISYNIDSWDNTTYTYKLKVTSLRYESGAYTMHEWYSSAIASLSAIGSNIVAIDTSPTSTWLDGPYNAQLIKKLIAAPETETTIAVDPMNLVSDMGFTGYVLDAETGAVIPGANVKISQGASNSNYDTYSTGQYSIALAWLQANVATTLETTKTGYTTNTHTFTPLSITGYAHNISLIKTPLTNANGTTIYGLVQELPYYLPSSGANVTINGSAPSSVTTGVTGYYIFNNLTPNAPYTLTTTKSGWDTNTTAKTTGAVDTNSSQNIILSTSTLATISLNVKDVDSGVAIDFATITVVEDVVAPAIAVCTPATCLNPNPTSTDGIYNGTYPKNINLIFTVTAVDYYNKYSTVTTDTSKTVDVLMSKVSQTGGSTQITQTHIVRFLCKDWQGNPVTDMNATVTAVQTTLGSTDWILYLFGYNLDKTPILNTTMTGTTDNSGSVVFVMIQTSKYAIHYEKPTQSIDETRYYYPMDQQYNEIFWVETPTISSSKITSSFYNTTNGTYMDLGVIYTDTSATDTTSFTFFVRDENHNLIYTNTNVTAGFSKNISYPVLKGTNGEIYYWGFSAVSASFTDPINRTNYIHFDEARWKLDPMCPSGGGTCGATVDTREFVYNGIAVIMINIFAYIFGRRSIKAGLVVVAAMGLFFYYIGWLQTTVLLMGVAFSLAVIWYIRFAEQESPD